MTGAPARTAVAASPGRLTGPLALAASILGAALVALDGTVFLVAQPALRHDLHASVAAVSWTSTGYLVTVAALLVLAGRLADRYGHRRLFAVGVTGFAAASAALVAAPSIGWVVTLRVAQGVFGALLQPATLGLLRLAWPADRLGTAVAVRTSAIGVASAAGPVLGGVLVGTWSWRAVFWLSASLAVLAALVSLGVTVRRAPAAGDRTGRPARPDVAGAVLLALTLGTAVHTLVGVPDAGWTAPPTVLGVAVTVAAAIALAGRERRARDPLVPRAVLASPLVRPAVALLAATTAALFGSVFVLTFALQDTAGLGPLAAGVRVLPVTAAMVVTAPPAGRALRRFGARRAALAGVALVTVALAGTAFAGVPSAAAEASFVLLGAGLAVVMVTGTGAVVGDAPPAYAGVVGALKQTAMNLGPTAGIAIAATVLGAAGGGDAPVAGDRLTVALLVLAGVAALGGVPAARLPGRAPVRTVAG